MPDQLEDRFAEARGLEGSTPEAILTWTADRFSRSGFTCSFGGTGIILAHMIGVAALPIPVYFLDTGFLFPETLNVREEFARRYGLTVVDVRPELTAAEQAKRHGPELYRSDPDLCCQMRKVDPMQRVLGSLDAWISGLRRDQSRARAEVDVVERHELETGRLIAKIHPLAHWSKDDCWTYIRRHGLPYNPLVERGFRSIGCWPCTARVDASAGERDGRWAGTGKTECGLHTFTRKLPEGQ